MIVITGGTGTVGRPLVDFLVHAGAEVRVVTRHPDRVRFPAGVQVVAGDPRQPATLADALRSATALFLHPRAVADEAHVLVAVARELGVRRVVALAAANVDDDPATQPSRVLGDRNREADDAAATSGLEWTSLRPTTYAGNALISWGPQLRAGDVVRQVHGRFEESPIHEHDLAEVAARAFLTDDLLGRRPVLTGPESLSQQRMVAIIGEVLGRPLKFEEVPVEMGTRGMLQGGVPAPLVDAVMRRFAAHLDRPQFPPTDEVARILGRPPRSFAAWVAENAAAFAVAA
jgi:uncharacterized protein YbjT (DUF2867 family)